MIQHIDAVMPDAPMRAERLNHTADKERDPLLHTYAEGEIRRAI